MVDIFISYASEDRSRVEPLAKSLEEQGWSVFWDRTIPAGKTWRQVIGDALRNARSIIVVWSKTSIESRWVEEEAERGLKRNVLIPIFIDNVEPPLGFGTIQAADLISWEPTQSSQEFDKLIADISAILGPSLRHVKEVERATENERKQKQEEERRRNEEEKRKKEEELQRLEKENRRIAEERRRFEDEQQRAELERKAKEEHKRKEFEAKRKAEEERKRKEIEGEEQRVRKAEAQRKAEEERKFKQRLPGKADATHIETEKADIKYLHTTRKVDEPIAAVPTRQLWLPILLTSLGWALSGAFLGARRGGAIYGYTGSLTWLVILGGIGGLVTAIVLRQMVTGFHWKQGFFVTIGWAISWGWAMDAYFHTGESIWVVIWLVILGGIGGLVTAIVLRQMVTGFHWKQGFFVTIGWAISWIIAGLIINRDIKEAIDWAIGSLLGPPIYHAIESAIAGAVGSAVTFYLLDQAKRRD